MLNRSCEKNRPTPGGTLAGTEGSDTQTLSKRDAARFDWPKPMAAEGMFDSLGGRKFGAILIDPPWRFRNRTGKMAPEHKRLRRYPTMSFEEIAALPIGQLALPKSHLYLWCPNALLLEALTILKGWGFTYKTNLVWCKVRKDGGPDGRGVGFYFRNVTELLLFGVRGAQRTLKPGRTQVNAIVSRKQEHSRKPQETYAIIEACSPKPFVELFARQRVRGWEAWGDQVDSDASTRPHCPADNGSSAAPARGSSHADK